MNIGRGLFGIILLIGITFLFSKNKKAINWTTIGMGIGLQIILALLLLKVGFVRATFDFIVQIFVLMITATEDASKFMFGELADASMQGKYGFAFYVLPTVIFFSAFSAILYFFGILQVIVKFFAKIMQYTMRLTGAESLSAAANVFIGQTEAPLVVKPYLEKMSKSEMMSLMTGGMATIAGGVFGAYMGILGGDSDAEKVEFGMHLLTASIISAPAAIIAAKILVPETEKDIDNEQEAHIPKEQAGDNFLDALARGTTDGLKLAVNVGAMLLAFTAVIYFINKLLMGFGSITPINQMIVDASGGDFQGLSLQLIFGTIFAPIAWIIGIDAADIFKVGTLLGEKMVLNEFFAYFSLGDMKAAGMLSERSVIISTYALCGFANFASIGIQIGGIGSIAPGQRKTLTELGLYSLIGGTIACLLTAAVASMII